MFTVDTYTPTRVILGPGRLDELATVPLPGKKALICVTADGLMEKLGVQQRVIDLLAANGVSAAVFGDIFPNPDKETVMAAAATAKEEECDFLLGLGGGSSIDVAKAAAIVVANGGDLWDYAEVGTGGGKPFETAAPIVTVSTTCGTGTETDQYCVVTKVETAEKIDFTVDALFPTLSIIDPELMVSLPKTQTMYQGFDAFFHNAECYITNDNQNKLLDLFTVEGFTTVYEWLPKALADGQDIEARTHMSYGANILGGYAMAHCFVTTHHIIGQMMGGVYPKVPHGATLIFIAKEFYRLWAPKFPAFFDKMGQLLGVQPDPDNPGFGFAVAVDKLMAVTGADQLKMSDFGVEPSSFEQIADNTINLVGIDWDRYVMTKEEIVELLEKSYR